MPMVACVNCALSFKKSTIKDIDEEKKQSEILRPASETE